MRASFLSTLSIWIGIRQQKLTHISKKAQSTALIANLTDNTHPGAIQYFSQLKTESNHFLGVCDAAENGWSTPKRSRLLIPRQISSFVFTPDDRPDPVVRCSPPGSSYSLRSGRTLE